MLYFRAGQSKVESGEQLLVVIPRLLSLGKTTISLITLNSIVCSRKIIKFLPSILT